MKGHEKQKLPKLLGRYVRHSDGMPLSWSWPGLWSLIKHWLKWYALNFAEHKARLRVWWCYNGWMAWVRGPDRHQWYWNATGQIIQCKKCPAYVRIRNIVQIHPGRYEIRGVEGLL